MSYETSDTILIRHLQGIKPLSKVCISNDRAPLENNHDELKYLNLIPFDIYDAHKDDILTEYWVKEVRLIVSSPIVYREKEDNDNSEYKGLCHSKSYELYQNKQVDNVMTGFALAYHNTWYYHSWNIKGNSIIDTQCIFQIYVGYKRF